MVRRCVGFPSNLHAIYLDNPSALKTRTKLRFRSCSPMCSRLSLITRCHPDVAVVTSAPAQVLSRVFKHNFPRASSAHVAGHCCRVPVAPRASTGCSMVVGRIVSQCRLPETLQSCSFCCQRERSPSIASPQISAAVVLPAPPSRLPPRWTVGAVVCRTLRNLRRLVVPSGSMQHMPRHRAAHAHVRSGRAGEVQVATAAARPAQSTDCARQLDCVLADEILGAHSTAIHI